MPLDLVLDIRWRICREFDLSRRDLCQLACTSRAWNRVAIPCIWEELRSMTPLFRLLPEDAYYEDEHTHDIVRGRLIALASEQCLKRSLTHEDWAHILERSSMVKRLDYVTGFIPGESWTESPRIVSRCPTSCTLFPRLRHLLLDPSGSFEDPSTAPCALITHSLSPCLETLHLPHNYTYLVRDICALASMCPCVHNLLLWTKHVPSRTQRSQLGQAIANWADLRQVVLGVYWDFSIILRLSTKRNLTSLSLAFHDFRPQDVIDGIPNLPSMCFPALEHLTLAGMTMMAVASLMSHGSLTRRLRTLHVSALPHESLPGELGRLTHFIGNHCAHDTLTSVFIERGEMRCGNVLTKEDLAPLCSFPRLTQLSLRLSRRCNLDDADYEDVTSRWPELETFEIRGLDVHDTEEGGEETLATMATLGHFARSCTKLKHLTLPLVLREIPMIEEDLLGTAHPLEKLEIEGSPRLASLYQIAMFLVQIFPALPSVSFDGSIAG
ncbi:hypothetical protein K523DRAFT_253687 [Schizophyllum commune Tattone D]|nr:hypothetical protein K523DRAFT_253687 [Schizophyllum commune Tattone D]